MKSLWIYIAGLSTLLVLAPLPAGGFQGRADLQVRKETNRERALAVKLISENRFKEAIGVLEPVCEGFPEYHDLAEMLSLAYIRAGRPEDAIALLEERLEKAPGRIEMVKNLGTAYLDIDEREKAIETWESVLGGEHGRPENYGVVSRLEWNAGMYDEAIGTLRAGLVEKKYYRSYMNEIIRMEKLMGRDRDAFIDGLAYLEAEKKPFGMSAQFLADIFRDAGSPPDLLVAVDSLAVSSKENRRFFAITGALLRAAGGDFSMLDTLVSGGLEIEPEAEEMYYVANAFFQMKDQRGSEDYRDAFSKVQSVFMKRFARSPMIPQMFLVSAQYYNEAGINDPEGGGSFFEKAVAMADSTLNHPLGQQYREKAALLKAGILLERLHMPEEALQALAGVRWTSPGTLRESEELRMLAFLGSGRLDEGKAWFVKLEASPDSSLAATGKYGSGMADFYAGEYSSAAGKLAEMAERYPWSKWANDALDAAYICRIGMDEDPAFLDLYASALRAEAKGEFSEAAEVLDKAAARFPESSLLTRAIFLKGCMKESLGMKEEAKEVFLGLVEEFPEDEFAPRALERAGEMEERGAAGEAARLYARILEEYPGYPFLARIRKRYVGLSARPGVPGRAGESR